VIQGQRAPLRVALAPGYLIAAPPALSRIIVSLLALAAPIPLACYSRWRLRYLLPATPAGGSHPSCLLLPLAAPIPLACYSPLRLQSLLPATPPGGSDPLSL